jgi:hypothetical protein
MVQAQSNQFTQYYLTDIDGTRTEITAAVRNAPVNRETDDMNQTTFPAGGGVVTERHRRGRIQSDITIECLLDRDLYALVAAYRL